MKLTLEYISQFSDWQEGFYIKEQKKLSTLILESILLDIGNNFRFILKKIG